MIVLNKDRVTVALDKKLIKLIDDDRGLVSRSAYLQDLIIKQLRAQGKLAPENKEAKLKSAY